MMSREPVANPCGCSFAAGMPVLMADGTTKPIERIHPGDQVLAKDEATGKIEAQDVQSTIHHPAAALVTVTLSGTDGKTQAITCTPEHPFYVDGRGWVEAGSLGIGSSLVTRAGPLLAVKGLDWQRSSAALPAYTVYNFTVDKDHTYFVGSADHAALVHNNCGSVLGDVFRNPNQLASKSLGEVKAMVGEVEAPWVEGTLQKGTHAGQGWTVRELSQSGEYTDRYLQWHPGGGRHGPDPYWKVSSGISGTTRVPSSGF